MPHPDLTVARNSEQNRVETRAFQAAQERKRLEGLLNLDVHGAMAPISQGRHLLCEIEKNLKDSEPSQPSVESARDLFKSGLRVQTDFEELAINIAEATNGAVLLPGIKDPKRLKNKIRDEYGGAAHAIFDVVRGSIVFDSLEDLYRAVEKIHSGAKIVRILDRFAHPRTSGYRDLKFNIEMTGPDGLPHIAELQFHLQGMLDAKEWETPLYKERRMLEEKRLKMKAQEANPVEIRLIEEKIARLQYDSQSVYGQVWKKYTEGIDWN